MEHYVTEEQQWEAIKTWFKRHGNRLSWVVIIVAAIISGGNYWRHHLEVVRERAADQYLAFLMTLNESENKTTNTEQDNKAASPDAEKPVASPAVLKGEQIIQDYPQSPYATLVAFQLAKDYVNAAQLDKADQHLRWVMNQGDTKAFRALARVRLMRLLFAQNALDAALKLYDESKAEGFMTEMAEIKGDILLKQNDLSGATMAYKKAYLAAPERMIGPLLKMKMENIGIDLDVLRHETGMNKKEDSHE